MFCTCPLFVLCAACEHVYGVATTRDEKEPHPMVGRAIVLDFVPEQREKGRKREFESVHARTT